MKHVLISMAAGIAACVSALPAAATTYHLVDLGIDSSALGINPKNEVAGSSPNGHASLYINGQWKDKHDRHHGSIAYGLDRSGNMVGEEFDGQRRSHLMYYPHAGKGYGIPLPGGSTYGYPYNISPGGISPDGTKVTGTFEDAAAGGNWHCFAWTPGAAVAVDIGLPAGDDICEAYGVNSSGEIVGQLWSEAAGFVGFTYLDGAFTLVGTQSLGSTTVLQAVNAFGHATGAQDGLAVFWDGSTLSTIPPQGSLRMHAGTAINFYDQVVGWGYNATGSTMVLYSGGVLTDLVPLIDNPEGWMFSIGAMPTGINDAGRVAGSLYDLNGHPHAVMLVPN